MTGRLAGRPVLFWGCPKPSGVLERLYRAVSSAGRASRLHREGRRFEPVTAHQVLEALISLWSQVWWCTPLAHLHVTLDNPHPDRNQPVPRTWRNPSIPRPCPPRPFSGPWGGQSRSGAIRVSRRAKGCQRRPRLSIHRLTTGEIATPEGQILGRSPRDSLKH